MKTVPVWLREMAPGEFLVTVFGMTDCRGMGETKEGAIAMLREHLPARFPGEVVELEVIESIDPHHPALEVAGIFADDPTFDEFVEILAENRRQDYLEMERYYAELDAKELVA
ncbi:MAG: hypothetical protein HC860_12500 [Alkalinema sp. RU_4_3]|nr:hypothetical protein [Alkalinema sp. RU_4_3]